MLNPAQTILLTGFEPFDGESTNPSWQIAHALQGMCVGGVRIESVCLPCVFGESLEVLDAALSRTDPSIVLCLGQAASRNELSIERVAINVDDARIPDNRGQQPVDAAVIAAGPAAYFTSLPIKAMFARIAAEGIPVGVSQTAGTFVCNHVFYGLMHRLSSRSAVRGGFMHVPLSTSQTPRAGGTPLPLDDMIRGVRVALEVAGSVQRDLSMNVGRED